MQLKFDITQDFFEANPAFKALFPLESSINMWITALHEHPDSPFDNFSSKEKVKAILESFPSQPVAQIVDSLKDKFNAATLSKDHKRLKTWEVKLEERDQFMDSIPYTAETFEMLDKLMSNSEKIWKQYLTIKKAVQAEQGSTAMGGQEESLQEQGLI